MLSASFLLALPSNYAIFSLLLSSVRSLLEHSLSLVDKACSNYDILLFSCMISVSPSLSKMRFASRLSSFSEFLLDFALGISAKS
jgi:hypothetical protein